jgi:Na+/H+ antiporter NhaC
MASKTQQQQQLAVQGEQTIGKQQANAPSHLQGWNLIYIMGLLPPILVLVMVYMIVQSGWIGRVRVISEPTGGWVVEMDNRPGLPTQLESQPPKETTAEES